MGYALLSKWATRSPKGEIVFLKFKEKTKNYYKNLSRSSRDIYLRKLQGCLLDLTGREVSESSLCRQLQRLKVGRKKTLIASEQLSERVQKRRYEWRLWLDSIDVRNLIFIDETGVNLGMVRRYGRSKGGKRAYDDRPGNQGKNVTLVGAMSDEGLIAAMTLPGGLNTPSFLVDLEKILLAELWVGAIVVMDNLPVHHVEAVESRIESVGARVKFLPPYSPDLSHIEFVDQK